MVHHPDFGWLAFGGNLKVVGDEIEVIPLDVSRNRIYIAPLGLWLTLDAGRFDQLAFNPKTGAVRVGLEAATPFTPVALLRIEQPTRLENVGRYRPVENLNLEREAWVAKLGDQMRRVELRSSTTK